MTKREVVEIDDYSTLERLRRSCTWFIQLNELAAPANIMMAEFRLLCDTSIALIQARMKRERKVNDKKS